MDERARTRAQVIRAQRSWGMSWRAIGEHHGISGERARKIGTTVDEVPRVLAFEPGEFYKFWRHATVVRNLWSRS